MADIFCHILVIAVAVWAAVSGFRKGLAGQASSVLGLAFGIVVTRVLSADAYNMAKSLFTGFDDAVCAPFILSVLSSGILYCLVFFVVKAFTIPLQKAVSFIGFGILDSLAGIAFSLASNMIFLSIFFNVYVCFVPQSTIMKYATAEDGNAVEAVMLLAPYALGCLSFEDLHHLIQLREARKISRNYCIPENVNTIGDGCGTEVFITLQSNFENA